MTKNVYLLLILLLLANTSMYGQRRLHVKTPLFRGNRPISVEALTRNIASYRPLREFPHHAFTRPISSKLLNQSFASLSKRELPSLTGPERTLLLTYKFIQENNVFPRTVIAERGAILKPEQYTPEQKIEIELGYKIRHTLKSESQQTPVRRELQELQHDFSPKYMAQRTLDNLNTWIETNHFWPKEHDHPITLEEIYETELAREANRIANNEVYAIPPELAEVVKEMRVYYDPTYMQGIQTLLNELQDWIAAKGSWPREEIFHEDPLERLTQQELSEIAFARKVKKLALGTIPATWPKAIADQVYTIREHYTDAPILKEDPSFPFSEREPGFSSEEVQSLLQKLELWITTEKRWPRSLNLQRDAGFTTHETFELTLRNSVKRLVLLSNPNTPEVWLRRPVFTDIKSVLHTGTPYRNNPILEQVRKLYYYAKYLEIQTEKGHLPENHYENFKHWYNELETLFPHDPYKDIELE